MFKLFDFYDTIIDIEFIIWWVHLWCMELRFKGIPIDQVLENIIWILLKVNEKSCEKCLHYGSTVI